MKSSDLPHALSRHTFTLSFLIANTLMLIASGCTPEEDKPAPTSQQDMTTEASVECVPDLQEWKSSISQDVETSCGQCHGTSPDFGAPYRLVDYDELLKGEEGKRPVDRMFLRMLDHTMPPPGTAALEEQRAQNIINWASCGKESYEPQGGLRVTAPVFEAPQEAPRDTPSIDFLADGFEISEDTLDL